jgi:hypothetical protein
MPGTTEALGFVPARPVRHRVRAVRAVRAALFPLLLAAISAACGRRGMEPPAEPLRVELDTDTTASGSLSLEPLLGALSISSALPSPEGWVDPGTTVAGWLFVDGQLIDRLPVETTLRAAAGNYEVKVMLSRQTPAGVSLWTVRTSAALSAGDTVHVRLGEALREWLENGELREGIAYAHVEPVLSVSASLFPDETGEARLAALGAQLQQQWDSFLALPEWKLMAAVDERFRGAPPSRSRVWVDLPDSLGGARELDAEQLVVLAGWYQGALRDRFGFRVPEVSRYDALGVHRPASAAFEGMYGQWQEAVNVRREWIDALFARVRAALERAGEEEA